MMKHYGFTLVELMVVVVIFLIIFAAIYGVLSMGWQSWYTGGTQVELQQETRKAMDRIVRELRKSGSTYVSIPVGGGSITFQVPVDDEGDGIVDDDVLDATGNIEWGAEANKGWSIQFFLDVNNRQILRKVFDGTGAEQASLERVLANNITTLSLNPVSSSEISIGITAQKDAIPGRTLQSNLHSQVTLRN